MYRSITLPNGARILTQRIPGVRSAALGFFVGAGSRHELASENGAAHFIEHMSFKGTATRSAGDLAREMDAIGGQVNAYTTKEHTCYYARCLDSHLDRAVDLLCDMLFASRFDQRDVEVERGVILEEIGMYEDTPEDLCAERLSMAVYKGDSLGRPILGRASTLEKMTSEWLRQWQQEHYRPQAMVVSLAGSFTQQHVDALVERLSACPRVPSLPAARPTTAAPSPCGKRPLSKTISFWPSPVCPTWTSVAISCCCSTPFWAAAAPPDCFSSCGNSGDCVTPCIPTSPTTPTPAFWVSTPA